MNKNEFIKAFSEASELSVKDAASAYDAFVGVVVSTLKSGDSISLVGFGTFEIKDKPARDGINPATKEKIKIAASKSPNLKFGKTFKELFN